MSSIRVLLLSNAITPDRAGGLERYVRDLGSALAAKGADVMIQARRVNEEDPERSTDADGVQIWRFRTPAREARGYALSYPAASARAVRAAVAEAAGTRVLHSHFALQALPLALAGSTYVHTFHAPVHRELLVERQGSYALPAPTQTAAVRLTRGAEARVLRRAREVVVLSEFMRAEAAALGAAAASTTLLPGGIDVTRFAPGPPSSDPWAHGDGPLLFTARRMVPRTGVTELIEAFAQIVRECPRARLAIAGRGPLEAEVRERIEGLGLGASVRMLGWISDEQLVGWYRAADVVLMPTQELEGFGLTTAEALACGTPVVATPAGANPEVLARLDASLLARDTSPQALAASTIALLADEQRLASLAQRARAAVDPELAWGTVADAYLALYERCGRPAPNGHTSKSARAAQREGSAQPDGSPGGEPSEALLRVLRTPGGAGGLELADASLLAGDGERFPIVGGIPVLLAGDSAFSAETYLNPAPQTAGRGARVARVLRRVLPSLSHNLSAGRNFARLGELLVAGSADGRTEVLVVGGAILGEGMAGLLADPRVRLIEADVAVGPRTDVICDAHRLPFADGSFDGVVAQAVLEHVADPTQVVAEIHRVLKPGGLVYSEIPFMQQVHEGAYDFTRFTYNGQRRLFRYFDEIDVGATAGPGMALGWSVRALLSALVGERRLARALVNLASTLSLFWLKYLDRPLMAGDAALDGASGLYFLGRSRSTPRSDGEIIAGYRGVNSGFSVRR